MRRSRGSAPVAEQLDIGFEGIEVVEPPAQEPQPDTMRQIVSLRMPDALPLADSVINSEPRLRGVALDVFEPEPPAPDSVYAQLLREFPERVILTPHMASRTQVALENMSWVVRDVMNVLEGRPPHWPAP